MIAENIDARYKMHKKNIGWKLLLRAVICEAATILIAFGLLVVFFMIGDELGHSATNIVMPIVIALVMLIIPGIYEFKYIRITTWLRKCKINIVRSPEGFYVTILDGAYAGEKLEFDLNLAKVHKGDEERRITLINEICETTYGKRNVAFVIEDKSDALYQSFLAAEIKPEVVKDRVEVWEVP